MIRAPTLRAVSLLAAVACGLPGAACTSNRNEPATLRTKRSLLRVAVGEGWIAAARRAPESPCSARPRIRQPPHRTPPLPRRTRRGEPLDIRPSVNRSSPFSLILRSRPRLAPPVERPLRWRSAAAKRLHGPSGVTPSPAGLAVTIYPWQRLSGRRPVLVSHLEVEGELEASAVHRALAPAFNEIAGCLRAVARLAAGDPQRTFRVRFLLLGDSTVKNLSVAERGVLPEAAVTCVRAALRKERFLDLPTNAVTVRFRVHLNVQL